LLAAGVEPIATARGTPEPTLLPESRIIRHVREHAMFVIDRHGRAASWHEGVRQILGWDEQDWIGQPAHVAFTPEAIAAGVPEQELLTAAEHGRADDNRWMMRRDGRRFYALGSVTRITDDAGRLLGFVKLLRDFTAAKQAEEERERILASERAARADAERQAAALTAAIEAIPDGVYIGTADGITRCNATGLAMLGAASLEDLQAGTDDLSRRYRVRHERNGPLADPGDLPFARALRGETAVAEIWATHATSGEDVFLRSTAAPIVVNGRIAGAVAVNTDLTDRLRLDQQRAELARVETILSERDEQLRVLVGSVRNYAIYTIDLAGRISSWHAGAALMTGHSAKEAIGMPFANLFTAEDRAAGVPQQELDLAARSGEFKGEGLRLRKDGSTFEASVVLTALRGRNGRPAGFLKLTQDISERRRMERERDQMLQAAQAARAEAERANHSKGEFLATISHELRTPLGAILGWAHVLERGAADAEALRQGLAAITRNARMQVQLIEDLLDMSRIESGQLRLEMQPVELSGVIAGAMDAVLPMATTKGVALRTVLDPVAGLVSGDPDRLQQIVWNLLTNAVKFTPAGGRVTVTLARAGAATRVSVADTGQGIEAEFLARVFDRFQQQDATSTRRHGGLGIGLAIVQQLVQLHGGQVQASSDGVGRGSTFTVSLPALGAGSAAGSKLEAAQQSVSTAAPPLPQDARPLDGVAVLLVDDEPDVRATAAYVLQAAGALVSTAADASEGIRLFREHRPRVILSDVAMPVHDGYDFLRWVRDIEAAEGGHTPAAAFTAFARPEDRQRALAAGYQAQLVKPVEPQVLVQAIVSLAGRSMPAQDDGGGARSAG
jgi:PAS domain S-box-containing protein